MPAQTLDYHAFVGIQYIFIKLRKTDLRPSAMLAFQAALESRRDFLHL